MTVARPMSFPDQLLAYKRARLGLSATRRSESPAAWWFGAGLKSVATVALGAASVSLGLVVAAQMNGGEAWTEVGYQLLYVPVVLWGWLLLTMLGADPLSRALSFSGSSRRCTSWLIVMDGFLSKTTVLMLTAGLTPWVVLHAAGQQPLSTAGWLGLTLALLVMCSWRQLMRALYVASIVAGGSRRSVGIVAMFLFAGCSLATSERSLSTLHGEGRGTDIASTLGSPSLIVLLVAGSALSLILAATLYAARLPRLDQFVDRATAGLGRLAPGSRVGHSVYHTNPVISGIRVQALRVARDPAAWLATGWLVVIRASEIATGTPGSLELIAFVTVTGGFYNLYGDQAPYYVAWLTSGRPLGTWTRSLVAVQLGRCGLVLVLGCSALLVPPWGDLARAGTFAWAILTASLIGALAGPLVSMRWPVPTRAHGKPVYLGAPVFISWGSSVAVGVTLLAARNAVGAGALPWALTAALAAVGVAVWQGRIGRLRWTSRGRARFHRAFAHHARS